MSNTSSNQLEESTKPLLYSGSAWHNRLIEDQLPLARQAASLFSPLTSAAYFDEIGNWISGVPGCPIFYPWAFKPTDVQVQGPDFWGYDAVTGRPVFSERQPTDVSRAHAYLTDDRRVVETQAGDVNSLPTDLILSDQTVWFLPRPADFHPVVLIAESGTLVEGTGFICAGNWVMFYANPLTLWPEGVIVSQSVRIARSWKSSTLKADNLHTSGREIALYRRNTQNLRQFERAICEIAGLPLLDVEGVLVRMETGGNQTIHWLDDGRSFILPGDSPYTLGQVVPANSGHILQLRHQALNGANWWRSRPWQATGIPIFVFRSNFFGFAIKDEMTAAFSLEDGPALRARLAIGQDPAAEDLFWTWQAGQERRLGTEILARGLLGFTAGGQTKPANPLEVFAQPLGPWLAVVETSLDLVDPRAFQEVADFIERERPAGMQVYLAGSSQAFTVPEFYAMYLTTGELTDIEPQVALAMPLGY